MEAEPPMCDEAELAICNWDEVSAIYNSSCLRQRCSLPFVTEPESAMCDEGGADWL